ncbi:MAG: hypothetical protein ACXWYG_11785 [Aeromicrobium sp.]
MATDTRPGFRLPWGSGAAATDDQTVMGVESGAEEAEEPTMIDTTPLPASSNGFEPTPTPAPASVFEGGAETTPSSVRRATKFMAELSRAMQAAVENARTETLARFEIEAKSVVDEIHAGAANGEAELRNKADGDVAAIREWSKSEIARVREETESRIAARKAGLDEEMVEHAATIEARTERIAAVVAAYEVELAAFFERLHAEEDPTRIATMAESMPEPPSLVDVAASVSSAGAPSAERPARVLAPTDGGDGSGVDFAAAEAEAASFTADLGSEDDLTPEDADQLRIPAVDEPVSAIVDAPPAEQGSTRVVVSGLVSVANIANFKRSLGRLAGVTSIAVASGRDGDFAFTVGHSLGSALSASVQSLPGFDIEITAEHDDAIVVTAKDRETNS